MEKRSAPLLELFESLRRAGLPLGVDSLSLLFQAIERGFGLEDREGLRRLCRALWCSSREDSARLDRLFEEHIPLPKVADSPARPSAGAQAAAPQLEREAPPAGSEPAAGFDRPAPVAGALDPLPEPAQPLGVTPASAAAQPGLAPAPGRPIDEARVAAQVVLQAVDPDALVPEGFAESDEAYFPITRRQMKQSWRYLRRMVREGRPSELDIGATMRGYREAGVLLPLILVPPRVNKAELLILVDRGGSMAPFHELGERLVQTALRGGRLGQFRAFSFHNYPRQYLFDYLRPPGRTPLGGVLAELHPEHGSVLIFSDAGAARGRFASERAGATAAFLKQVRRHVRRVVWINPMPRERWTGTTAERIAAATPMFEVDRRGLQLAIRALRSRGGLREEAS